MGFFKRFITKLQQALPQAPPPRPAPKAGELCFKEYNKRVFATRADAQRFVEKTQHRYAAGQVATPLDHEYECPYFDHWHVSSKPRWS